MLIYTGFRATYVLIQTMFISGKALFISARPLQKGLDAKLASLQSRPVTQALLQLRILLHNGAKNITEF